MSSKRSKASRSLQLFVLGPGVGESIVLRLPDGRWGVVDCFQREPGKGVGTLDFLKNRRVKSLAFFCHTHPHEDHFLGSHALLATFSGKIENIWRHPGFSSRDFTANMVLAAKAKAMTKRDLEAERVQKEYSELLKGLSRERKLISSDRYRRVSGSGSLLKGKGYEVFSLGPQAGVLEKIEERLKTRSVTKGFLVFGDDEGGIINNLSVVLHISFGRSDVFLLADAQGKNIHIHPQKRRCTLIKAAHHGSDNGLACNLITDSQREYRINNTVVTPFLRSRLPSEAMIGRYQASCTRFRLTSNDPIQPAEIAVLGFVGARKVCEMKGWIGVEVTSTGRISECEV